MAKCQRCGKGGLFRKVDKSTGICTECHEKELAARVFDLNTEIQQKSRELSELQNYESVKFAIRDLEAQRAELSVEISQASRTLENTTNRTYRLKALAKSITEANANWVSGALSAANTIDSLEIENLLPELDLNCMTVKTLRSQYNGLRKQVIDLCKAYEARYTTKTNTTIYKLVVLGMEAEMETILYKLQFGGKEKANDSVRAMTAKYYSLAVDGNQTIVSTLKTFIGQIESLYLDIVAIEYEYYVQRERVKEEQRALKEQMRQEAEERKQLEQEKKKVEAEERKYNQEIERLNAQLETAKDNEIEKLKARLAEVTALIGKVEEKKAEIINLQNGKAGTVYVISNIGSFGDDVFKVGMTRRLEPLERVKELGDASVPFPFDVHSFIFSEDAPALETALHKELNNMRVNKVNLRKEFFRISIEEIQAMVERYDPTASFRMTAAAEQYRQSLTITDVPDEIPVDVGDDDDE